MDPDNTSESRPRRAGRLRAAFQALTGAPVVPSQIRAEWVGWQFELEGLCDKLTTTAARLYQRDKRALEAAEKRVLELEAAHPCGCEDAEVTGAVSTGGWNPAKRLLNRRVLAGRGMHPPEFANGGEDVGSDQS